jgi:hypothetical protein
MMMHVLSHRCNFSGLDSQALY